jgi:preprotein translocase subunit YajC
MENNIDNKKQLAIIITAGIIIFLIGGILGIFIYRLQNKNIVENKKAVSSLSSKVVSSVVVYGQVKSINGKSITLSNLGDDLTIIIADNAQVFSFATATVQQKVNFEDIKVGDSVNISVKLLSTGQLEGLSVIILPQSK